MLRGLLSIPLLFLAACATDRPLAFGCTRMDEFRVPVDATPEMPVATMAIAGPSPLSGIIAQTITARGPAADVSGNSNNFLVLSGGGSWGAFGAGFLQGWSWQKAADRRRPANFNLVTGVSTGALQATFAFLGQADDRGLVDAYTIERERELVRRHGSLFFIRHASRADTGPLASYLRERIGPLLDRVAAEGPAERCSSAPSMRSTAGCMRST